MFGTKRILVPAEKAEKKKSVRYIRYSLVFAAAAVLTMVFSGCSKSTDASASETESFSSGNNTDSLESGTENLEGEAEQRRLYPVWSNEIDIYAENRQPNERDLSLKWDNILFYTLEDVSAEETDGQIAMYDVTKRELINIKTGTVIEYEVYTNPETGKINKIVSIEDLGEQLEITDYYYTDEGRINFIYMRNDSIYTPTYATIDKTGNRYYFDNDTMVKWRWIQVPRQVEEIITNQEDVSTSYIQNLYAELNSEKQDEYAQIELKMLNAAYNTYDAVKQDCDYGNLKGYVLAVDGTPITRASIRILSQKDDYELGEITTDNNGYYETGIPFDSNGYRLAVSCNSYLDTEVYNLTVDKSNVTNWVENIYLIKESGNNYEIQMDIYDVDKSSYDSSGNFKNCSLGNARITVRTGINNKNGGIVSQIDADSSGKAVLTLEAGIYTIEINVDGYAGNYITLIASENKSVRIPMSEKIAGNQMKVILTWDKSVDLDSCLFTPYKSVNGDMAYVNGANPHDEKGNQLIEDSKDGQLAEVIYISDITAGDYKYYVSDYANCLNGNLTAADMKNMNVRVQIYDKNGLMMTLTLPENLQGVIWEVFEIKNGRVIALQHTYANIKDKIWWSTDKSALEMDREARQAYYDFLVNGKLSDGIESNSIVNYFTDGEDPEEEMSNYNYILRDIDGDGVMELCVTDDIGIIEEESLYIENESLIFIMDYVDGKVTAPFEDSGDMTEFTYLLNDNTLCYIVTGDGILTSDIPAAYQSDFDGDMSIYYGDGNSYHIYRLDADGTKEEIITMNSQTNVTDDYDMEFPSKYFIDGNEVSTDEWNVKIQEYFINKLIQTDAWKSMTVENLKAEMVDRG